MLLRWLLALLQLAALASCAPFSRRWSAFNRHNQQFKPFRPKSARFATPLRGFSNIFQDTRDGWGGNLPGFPAIERSAWGRYPANAPRLQPLPRVPTRYRGFPVPRPNPVPRRQHQFYGAGDIETGKVPTVFMTDAEVHGLVCVPASSLGSALAGHRDSVTTSPRGDVTMHRTVLAGRNGDTTHSTRITSGDTATVVETRTNSSSGVQHHRQAVTNTGSGVVRSSTGSAFSKGHPGKPTFADVLTSSESVGGTSRSRATATGFGRDKALPSRFNWMTPTAFPWFSVAK